MKYKKKKIMIKWPKVVADKIAKSYEILDIF